MASTVSFSGMTWTRTSGPGVPLPNQGEEIRDRKERSLLSRSKSHLTSPDLIQELPSTVNIMPRYPSAPMIDPLLLSGRDRSSAVVMISTLIRSRHTESSPPIRQCPCTRTKIKFVAGYSLIFLYLPQHLVDFCFSNNALIQVRV